MAEITLKKRNDVSKVPFVVNIENEENGKTETYKYFVKRFGGKALIKAQLLNAEFARDKDRESIVGSNIVKEILDNTRTEENNNLELIDLFDYVDDDQLVVLIESLIKAASSSTVNMDY